MTPSAPDFMTLSPGGKVLGLDIDPASIALIRKHCADRTSLRFETQDLDALLPNTVSEPFDPIYCRFLLCHLSSPQEQLNRVNFSTGSRWAVGCRRH
ncbi:MAG: methyltransferase [Endozoicomonas sp.]